MNTALAEMRDNSAGVLIVGANESTSLYVLQHIVRYRRLYPKVKVRVRRSLSSKIPSQLIDGELELGVISFDPQDDRLKAQVIFTDHLAFVVSPTVERVDHGARHGNIHRTQCSLALSRSRPAGVSASPGAAQHGCRDANR
jgi:DNA-binding transcriptional LysR family regulator